MKTVLRGASFVLLLALWISTMSVFAQDDTTTTDHRVVGSRIVVDALSALNDASDAPIEAEFTATGTSTGIQTLCTGGADVAGAIRPMSVDEETLCQNNNVAFKEYLIGYNVLTIVTNPSVTFADCLTSNQVSTLFAPSAQGVTTDWAQIGLATTESVPLTVILPPSTDKAFGLLDEQILGTGVRTDVQSLASTSAVLDQVATTPGAVGVVSLADVNARTDVRIVQLQNGELGTCVTPSLEAVDDSTYPAYDPLYVYVNQAAEAPLSDYLSFVTSDDSASALQATGLTAPTEDSYTLNQAILAGEEDPGRQFTLEVTEFQIPADAFGTVTIGGAASLGEYAQSTTTQFTTTYPNITTTLTVSGTSSGIRDFCSGLLDMVFIGRLLTEEEQTICENNTINPVTFDFGKKAVVLVANATPDGETDDPNSLADYPVCLTPEQVVTIWRNSPTAPQSWHDLDATFPDAPLVLVAPELGASDTDQILTTSGSAQPVRLDVAETNDDPAYRAAAIANVRGGLTFMSWTEYQDILARGQGNIQLVAISIEGDCITPSEDSIADLSYPYALPGQLLVSQSALSRTEVQSYVWYLFENNNYTLYTDSSYTGISYGDLQDIRANAQAQFNDALAATLEPTTTETQTGILGFDAPISFPYSLFPSGDSASSDVNAEATPEATAETN